MLLCGDGSICRENPLTMGRAKLGAISFFPFDGTINGIRKNAETNVGERQSFEGNLTQPRGCSRKSVPDLFGYLDWDGNARLDQ